MKVSFVVPSRNQAPFLARCLEGCLSQRIPDREVIVVDGASTDGTQEVLRGFGERISWTSRPDRGQADAVNQGVARASGEVIAWINSDDAYEDAEVLPAVLDAFREPQVDLVYGHGTVVDEQDRPIRPYRNRRFDGPAELLASAIGPSQPATFFRKALFERVGGLDERLHWALDYDLFLRMFAAARAVRYLPQPLARMTAHPAAKSVRGMLPQIRELAKLKRDHASRLGLGPLRRASIGLGVAQLYAYWLVVRLGLRRAT
jgi:glycosyltransferase involved in cell wall biosynthesis